MEVEKLVVVEIASVLAGPSVGMFFAELGASVIKIEPKLTGGDVTRSWKLANETKSSKISAYFSSVNYQKEYYFLDFNDQNDFKQVIDFIKSADIVITNFKKGDDIKFGLDFLSLKKLNSKLIYGAISGFGNESDRVAYDLILQAETGFMSMNGSPKSGPVKMPVALIDVLAGHQLKEGILLALLSRGKKGGALVNVSLYDTAIASLANQASNYLMTGHVAERIGSLHPNIAPYGEIFKTKDDASITFAIGSNKQFISLLSCLDLNLLSTDSSFENNVSRVENRIELAGIIASKVKEMQLKDILDYCHHNFIPVAEIKNMQQVFKTKKARDMILEETIENIKTARVKTIAFKII
ncbi:MAG: CaiB/BaiF CoA transferase family protein [Crocinitomicaceae bacterium]